MTKRGLLLLNLGTPEGPTTAQVRAYLREFLMDEHVIDIAYPLRWLLVEGLILPTRPAKSAEAYQKIWTERGSPLLFHLEDLTQLVRAELGADWVVEPAMRYGEPSIEKAIARLRDQGITDVTVAALYPQYSLSATVSSERRCTEVAKKLAPAMRLQFLPAFYREKGFIGSFAEIARATLDGFAFDHLLFSFHGLPERHVKKTDKSGAHCFGHEHCCNDVNEKNPDCYRAQCFVTARELARELELTTDRYTVCFQSRLGRTPWIRPFTDHVYADLARNGTKRLAVMCPAFVADCLETLEEIQIRAREDFIRLGGEDLRLVPSLNASPGWARSLSDLVREFQTS